MAHVSAANVLVDGYKGEVEGVTSEDEMEEVEHFKARVSQLNLLDHQLDDQEAIGQPSAYTEDPILSTNRHAEAPRHQQILNGNKRLSLVPK